MKKIVLIGPMGYGKSTTGNTLLKGNYFSTGNDLGRVTTEIRCRQSDTKLVVDCPGFGDTTDYSIFYNEMLKFKETFLYLCPIDAFVMVIKFDCDQSAGFLKAAEEFVSCFGTQAVSSLMLLCIQGSEKRRYAVDDFEKILYSSDGYKYLVEKNRNLPLPYCLWDNINPYVNQEAYFEINIFNLHPFSEIMLKYSFDLIQKEKLLRNALEKEKELNDIRTCKDCRICFRHKIKGSGSILNNFFRKNLSE